MKRSRSNYGLEEKMKSKIAMHLAVVYCFAVYCFAVAPSVFLSSALGQQPGDVLDAVKAGVESEEQFQTVFEFIRSAEDDERWREIPWVPSLWTGVKTADEQRKPIFVWAMNGDPLGCV